MAKTQKTRTQRLLKGVFILFVVGFVVSIVGIGVNLY